MTREEFVNTCLKNGFSVRLIDNDPRTVGAYIESPIFKYDGKGEFFWWDNAVCGGGCVIVGYYNALWLDYGNKYGINCTDLGDCMIPLRSVDELDKICKAAMAATKKLESDDSFRPTCIELSTDGYSIFEE